MGWFFLMEILHGEKKSRSFFHKQSEALGYISAVKQISGGSLDPKTQPQKRYVVEKDFFWNIVNRGVTGFFPPSFSYVFQDCSKIIYWTRNHQHQYYHYYHP